LRKDIPRAKVHKLPDKVGVGSPFKRGEERRNIRSIIGRAVMS